MMYESRTDALKSMPLVSKAGQRRRLYDVVLFSPCSSGLLP